jgi:LAO/AO transport system kinase
LHPLVERITAGDRRAAARAMTLIENDAPEKRALLRELYAFGGRAHIVGFTGSPGAGKSTLVDQVIAYLRGQGQRVGVLAVDPSSPFSGGALLGDRIRMTRHSADPGVYIRSMGTRGAVGGLAKAARDVLYVLEAYGCDVILVETVGVGQSELDVLTVADTVGLVLTPGAGDHVQTAKSGIMEIADVYVVNKADLPGADMLVREIELMLRDKSSFREDWRPPIVRTVAAQGAGTDELWSAVTNHLAHLKHGGWRAHRRRKRHREETMAVLLSMFRRHVEWLADEYPDWQDILEGAAGEDPQTGAEALWDRLGLARRPGGDP